MVSKGKMKCCYHKKRRLESKNSYFPLCGHTRRKSVHHCDLEQKALSQNVPVGITLHLRGVFNTLLSILYPSFLICKIEIITILPSWNSFED